MEKVSNIIKKEFNSKLVHNKRYIKINTKEGCQCICTTVILIDSVCRKDKTYYPQVLLEKYDFSDDTEIYSDEKYSHDSDDSDEEIQMNKIPMKKIQIKEIKCINLYQKETNELISSYPEMLEMRGEFLQKCNKFLFSGLCKFPPEIKEIIF